MDDFDQLINQIRNAALRGYSVLTTGAGKPAIDEMCQWLAVEGVLTRTLHGWKFTDAALPQTNTEAEKETFVDESELVGTFCVVDLIKLEAQTDLARTMGIYEDCLVYVRAIVDGQADVYFSNCVSAYLPVSVLKPFVVPQD